MLPPQPDDRQYQYSVSGGRANDEERELVDLIADIMPDIKPNSTKRAERVIETVKANLGKIAEICPKCSGLMLFCEYCGHTGIVPKGK
jgi:hypothetical protein